MHVTKGSSRVQKLIKIHPENVIVTYGEFAIVNDTNS